jgi:hypothetical protein
MANASCGRLGIVAFLVWLGVPGARRIRQDDLLRDTMVYVTCLHEIGHALGLSDSDDDPNIMWGGGRQNLSVYQRYRQRLQDRGSIVRVSWLSKNDIARAKALYSRSDGPHPR